MGCGASGALQRIPLNEVCIPEIAPLIKKLSQRAESQQSHRKFAWQESAQAKRGSFHQFSDPNRITGTQRSERVKSWQDSSLVIDNAIYE